MSLIERKKRLARLVRAAKCSRLLYAQHIERHGKGFFAEICARDLEGIVAKCNAPHFFAPPEVCFLKVSPA